MPMYEYKCDTCGIVFEAMQKFSDAPLTDCTACGGPVQKQISQTAFSLKGGGWYQHGYSGGAPAASCSSASGAPGAGCSGCPKASNG